MKLSVIIFALLLPLAACHSSRHSISSSRTDSISDNVSLSNLTLSQSDSVKTDISVLIDSPAITLSLNDGTTVRTYARRLKFKIGETAIGSASAIKSDSVKSTADVTSSADREKSVAISHAAPPVASIAILLIIAAIIATFLKKH